MSLQKSFEAPLRPGSISNKQVEQLLFPFEAFEITDPAGSSPTLSLKADWGISVQGGERIGKVTVSSSAPSGGAAGDLWIQTTAGSGWQSVTAIHVKMS